MITLIPVRKDIPDSYEGFESTKVQEHLLASMTEIEMLKAVQKKDTVQKKEPMPNLADFEQAYLYNIRLSTDFRFDPIGFLRFSVNKVAQHAILTELELIDGKLHEVYVQELATELDKELLRLTVRNIDVELEALDAQTISFLKRLGFQEIGRKFSKKL